MQLQLPLQCREGVESLRYYLPYSTFFRIVLCYMYCMHCVCCAVLMC